MNPPDSPQETPPQPTPTPPEAAPGLGPREWVSVCAAGLAICFFVPWIDLLIARPSGLDLQRDGAGKLFWLLPALAAATIVAGFTGKSQKLPGILAGLTPFAFLAYGLVDAGSRLFDVMAPGAWVGLVLGAALLALSLR
jgi:hypothetical protein